jgi:hypothetical protein
VRDLAWVSIDGKQVGTMDTRYTAASASTCLRAASR